MTTTETRIQISAAADPTILALRKSLCDEATPLPVRFRALFSLKHLAKQATDGVIGEGPESANPAKAQAAIDAIAAGFVSPSALLKHELAYCLGQTGNVTAAGPPLRAVLADVHEDPMCRHEAAEALGALGDAADLPLLARFRDAADEPDVIRETCEIAADRIAWANSPQRRQETLQPSDFASVDPAPPMAGGDRDGARAADDEGDVVESLQKDLLDTSLPLFRRYRAMFSLRDLASPPDRLTAKPAVLALAQGLQDGSALFRHEIAFVFGQLSHPASVPALTAALSNVGEASMVRHEAAEALGSLGSEAGVEDTLRQFLHDKEKVVRESVIVALDMADYEQGSETEYALVPDVTVA